MRDAVILPNDIFDLSGERLLRAARLAPGEAALLIGGPPCQPFSLAGQRHGLSDHRGHLVDEYLRVVRHVDPTCLVFENVPGIRSVDDGKVLSYLKQQLSRMDYHVEEHVLNAADYGVPQVRSRVFLFGRKSRVALGAPAPTHSAGRSIEFFGQERAPHRTVRDALSSLPPATSGGLTARKIAATIKARKEKQDWAKLVKRKHSVRPEAQLAMEPIIEALQAIAFPDRFITLFTTTWLFSFTAHELAKVTAPNTKSRSLSEITALARTLAEGDLPEKTRDAFDVLGARPLLRAGILLKSPSSLKDDPAFEIDPDFLSFLRTTRHARKQSSNFWREKVADAF